jgi:hypothetical protein
MTDPIASAAARALDESSQPAPACIGMRRHEVLIARLRKAIAEEYALTDTRTPVMDYAEELADEYEIAVAQALRLERVVHGTTKGEGC